MTEPRYYRAATRIAAGSGTIADENTGGILNPQGSGCIVLVDSLVFVNAPGAVISRAEIVLYLADNLAAGVVQAPAVPRNLGSPRAVVLGRTGTFNGSLTTITATRRQVVANHGRWNIASAVGVLYVPEIEFVRRPIELHPSDGLVLAVNTSSTDDLCGVNFVWREVSL